MADKPGYRARVTITCPEETLEGWKEVARELDMSLSALVSEWMADILPGLRDVAALKRAYEEADQATRQRLRDAVAEVGRAGQEALLGSWKPVQEAVQEAESIGGTQ